MNYWQTTLFENDIIGNNYEEICKALTNNKMSYLLPDLFGKRINKWSKNNISKPINTLCLFSGAGGLDIGFHDAGFNIVECVEIEPNFVKTLEENKSQGKYFSHTNIVCKDIRLYQPKFSQKIDFIIGGPPCQSFSKAGIRAAGAKGINDERGTLFEEYVRILKQLKPKGFLFENVTGILSAQKGEAMNQIVKAFEDVGYTLHFRVLDTSDYGVPQNRERLILVGTKKDEYKFPSPTHGIDSKNQQFYFSASEALKGLISEDVKEGLNGRFGYLLNNIPAGLNYSFYTEKMGHPNPVFAWRSKFSDFLYKADPDLPVRTIKASGGQYTGPFHWKNRHFTINELKRLQTFPDDYIILGGRGLGAKQIGNSVPPQFARILAISVLEQIFNAELPFELNKLEEYHKLSFRKLKSQRTKYYAEKAKRAIEKIDVSKMDNSVPDSRNYYATVLNDTVLIESEIEKEDYNKITFSNHKDNWVFSLEDVKSKNNTSIYNVDICHKNNDKLFGKVERVILKSNSYDLNSYLILWKAFERELIRNHIKADLVQLNGYYQYKPILNIEIQIDMSLIPQKLKNEWNFMTLMVQDNEYNQIRELNQIAEVYEMNPSDVISVFRNLKKLGFEIRNTNTNSEISKNHYLIPYQFPSLNYQSLQRQTQL